MTLLARRFLILPAMAHRRIGDWLLLVMTVLLLCSRPAGGIGFPLGSRTCPSSLLWLPVEITDLIVEWNGRTETLRDVMMFEQGRVQTGQMTVVFKDLDPALPFDHYLVIATPVSKLSEDLKISEVREGLRRAPDPDGLVRHHLNLEPGTEYTVEVYATAPGYVTLLSGKPDYKAATTLLSPLYFGGYQLDTTWGCSEASDGAGCVITAETEFVTVATDLTLDAAHRNTGTLDLGPRGSPHKERTVRMLKPFYFGPGDHLSSDRADKVTHYQLRVMERDGRDKPAFFQRIDKDDEGYWVVSSNSYAVAFDGSGQARDVEGNPLPNNTRPYVSGHRFVMQLEDGEYIFDLHAVERKVDADTDQVTWITHTAPSRLEATIGPSTVGQFTQDEYKIILEDIERDIDPQDDDLEYSLWFDLLYPDWKNGEYLYWAADDLAFRFDQSLD
ncbi:MAG: hypothetical protein F4Y37_06270 [Caldilineaceae bacterium SB0664_bin_22]|nr:hypothetical protein [Caldilineaceae bacterium SB0664_bin_22]